MAQTEASVQAHLRALAHVCGAFLGRNNSGAYNPKKPPSPGTRWGWCNDSAQLNAAFKTPDLIGYTTIEITPEMVGRKIAVFTGVEVKSPDWKLRPGDKRAQAQNACLTKIKADGGIAFFATEPSQLIDAIDQYKNQ